MSYWEPDDPPELPEGWIDEDTADTLRALLKLVESPLPPRPGNRSDAALVMLDFYLNPPNTTKDQEDPNIVWARILLKDVL